MKDSTIANNRMSFFWGRWGVIEMAVLSMILAIGVASYGKWFYPLEELRIWEKSVALFEVFFIGALWFFRFKARLWLIAALLFASWGGYAGFWYQVKIPCACMGTKFPIPTLYTMGIDALFMIVSLLLAKRQGCSQRILWLIGGALVLAVLFGFLLAKQIYLFKIFQSNGG